MFSTATEPFSKMLVINLAKVSEISVCFADKMKMIVGCSALDHSMSESMFIVEQGHMYL